MAKNPFNSHKQYKPPEKTRKEARFDAKKRDAAAEDSIQFTMRTLKEQVFQSHEEAKRTRENYQESEVVKCGPETEVG